MEKGRCTYTIGKTARGKCAPKSDQRHVHSAAQEVNDSRWAKLRRPSMEIKQAIGTADEASACCPG